MADIIELILADHRRIRRLLGALGDAARYGEDPGAACILAPVWDKLAGLLELHAEAEEEICYLAMFGPGPNAAARMQDAIADHDDIREAVAEARLHPPGSAAWWRAVTAARQASRDHIACEEHGVLAAFGRRATPALRDELGRQWAPFIAARTLDAIPDGRGRPRRAGAGHLEAETGRQGAGGRNPGGAVPGDGPAQQAGFPGGDLRGAGEAAGSCWRGAPHVQPGEAVAAKAAGSSPPSGLRTGRPRTS